MASEWPLNSIIIESKDGRSEDPQSGPSHKTKASDKRMGGCCCKCTPRWANDDDIVCAYVYEDQTARSLVEGDIFDPHGIPISIAEEVPKASCCGYEMFEAAVMERLNKEWVPKMNRLLDQYGFEVDGFEWVEMRYVSHGQYGGHTQPVPHFCIRIRKAGNTERDVQVVEVEAVKDV